MSILNAGWMKDLAGQLLTGGLAQGVRSAQMFLEDAIHHVLDEAAESFRQVFVIYAGLAGLALVAIIALGTAFTQGLVALGLPGWASHLILATVAGLLAAVVYVLAGKGPTGAKGDVHDEESGSPGSGGRGFTIKVVHVHPPAASASKASRRVVEVRPAGDHWEVKSGRGRKKLRAFGTKRGAVRAAMAAARKESAEVVIAVEARRKTPFQGVA